MRGDPIPAGERSAEQAIPALPRDLRGDTGSVEAALALSLLGSVSLVVNGRAAEIKSRKAQALLGFLALEATLHPVLRERLCGLLWSESPEEKARASLRQALHELKSVINPEVGSALQADRETIGLSGAWTTDVAEILARLQVRSIDSRLLDRKMIAASLLLGCEDLDPSFGTWLIHQRQLVEDQLTRGLERLLREPGASSELSRQAARALLNLDPTHEEACRHLMRDATARGDTAGALKSYRRLWELLEEEYDTEPSQQTQALAIELKTCAMPASPAEGRSAPRAVSETPSIAVLPFSNMSGDPEQEYFADGIVEDITTALSRIRWFFVMARNSSFTYKGRDVDVRAVSRDLGVRYLLEGSVRRSEDRLRINAQLIDATTGHHIWAERYDGVADDVFAFQDRITEAVVGSIEPSIRRAEIGRATRKPTSNLAAYDRMLRALPLISLAEREGIIEAEGLLLAALESDPGYAYAMALLARCSSLKLLQHWGTDTDRREGIRFAREAIACGPDDPLALAEAAIALAYLGREYAAAMDAMERSLALHPSCAGTHNKAGWLRVYVGEPAPAIRHFETAIRLSPLDLAMCHFLTGYAAACLLDGRCEDAYRLAEKAVAMNPGWGSAHRTRVAALVQLGRIDDARTAARLVLEISPQFRLRSYREHSPYQSVADWHRFVDCLRAAGLPD